ncbi:hypothetical protein D3C86_1312180 [compost metagenome]
MRCGHTGSTDPGISFAVRSILIIESVSRPSGHNIHTRCNQIRLNAQISIGVRTSRAEIRHFIPGLSRWSIITAKGEGKRRIRVSNQLSCNRSALSSWHIKSRDILQAIAKITNAANDTISAIGDTRFIKIRHISRINPIKHDNRFGSMAFCNGYLLIKIKFAPGNESYLVLDKLLPARVLLIVAFKSKTYVYALDRIGSKHRTEVLLCSAPSHQIHILGACSRRQIGRSYVRLYLC